MLKYVSLGVIALCAIFILPANATSDEALKKRTGKLFPVFQVVTFPNAACTSTASKNGTCYTAAECAAKKGLSAGTCAQSYGVCCVFSLNCGQTSSQNCSYFESTGVNAGTCTVDICKCNPSICQLRLDFNTFSITGPSTSTITQFKVLNGVQATGGTSATLASECLTDTFSVTNPNGPNPPVICGTNTGQHMYVDASDACNKLSFQLGASAIGTTLAAARSWSIKITQYSCSYNNLAPPGCTEYFFGSNTGTVSTYNYAGGEHLANQNENICVRRERGNCRICWTTITGATDFSVSSSFPSASLLKQSACCNYGPSGKKTIGADCATIPGALTKTKLTMMGASRICGSMSLLALTSKGMMAKKGTVCSQTIPFSIRFLSDSFEYKKEAAKLRNKGFNLAYIMSTSGCIGTSTTG